MTDEDKRFILTIAKDLVVADIKSLQTFDKSMADATAAVLKAYKSLEAKN
jgi:inorganic pyrophosphatase